MSYSCQAKFLFGRSRSKGTLIVGGRTTSGVGPALLHSSTIIPFQTIIHALSGEVSLEYQAVAACEMRYLILTKLHPVYYAKVNTLLEINWRCVLQRHEFAASREGQAFRSIFRQSPLVLYWPLQKP